jgi:hypothetical protein
LRFEGAHNFESGVTASMLGDRTKAYSCVHGVMGFGFAIKSLWHLSDDKETARLIN